MCFISFGFLLATICVWVWMVCSLHSVTTGSRDRANVSLIIIIIIHTCYFGTFTYGRLQQREKSARREGHPCLRFVHDFVSVVFDTRKSCGRRHFSTKRTVMRPLRGQNFMRGSQPLKYCFDLYSSRLYLENLVLALRLS